MNINITLSTAEETPIINQINNNNKIKCTHKKHKYYCRECKGKAFCMHGKHKRQCELCNLQKFLIQQQRVQIHRALKNIILSKESNFEIQFLGCTAKGFYDHLKSKFIVGMSFENIQMDHIKPVSAFDLELSSDFMECCHYTNYQPLFAKDNLSKGSRWSHEDNIYWKNNIINQDYKNLYIPIKRI
jgi:hypothetical protein